MVYSQEVKNMCVVHQGVHHGAAPIPEEAKWVKSREIKDISGDTHGDGAYRHLRAQEKKAKRGWRRLLEKKERQKRRTSL